MEYSQLTLMYLEARSNKIIDGMARDYMNDGYKLVDYVRDDKMGTTEYILTYKKNTIRLHSVWLNHEINVYKNGKFNKKVDFKVN